jgi:hypothetical protein
MQGEVHHKDPGTCFCSHEPGSKLGALRARPGIGEVTLQHRLGADPWGQGARWGHLEPFALRMD